jgi:hypothetical protein
MAMTKEGEISDSFALAGENSWKRLEPSLAPVVGFAP